MLNKISSKMESAGERTLETAVGRKVRSKLGNKSTAV